MSSQQFDTKSLRKFFMPFFASVIILFLILLLMTTWKGPYTVPGSGNAHQTEGHE